MSGSKHRERQAGLTSQALDRARWITVSNRLPFSLSSDGKRVSTSSGGLVSALSGVKSNGPRVWVGCAPDGLTDEAWPRIKQNLADSSWIFEPVFYNAKTYDLYYNGCCNDVLWPLLHYETNFVDFKAETWAAYKEMNEKIAAKVVAIAEPNDIIWVHDSHLFLVAKLIKQQRPELKVGFFLHVPFPSSEVFRQIPAREEILNALLEAVLVGFHDYSYLRHFGSSLLRLLGIESSFLSVKRADKVTRLGVFPVSIDTENFMERSRDPRVLALTEQTAKPYFLFLGVDRLDYIKGLDLKLKSFRTLLRRFPQYREKVGLLQVAVPTRSGVPVYNRLAREIARLVGEINGEFSTPNWTPVQYIHASITPDRLISLYKAADALVVTSKRDGMNLVALEYIAAQDRERPGVVLLSEFAGAISTLSHTLSINPWDLEDTARKMQLAMEMPKHERLLRVETMQRYLSQYSATDWANTFITELQRRLPERREGPEELHLTDQSVAKLAHDIGSRRPSEIILFLDYDGTLVPIQSTPEQASLPLATRRELVELAKLPWLDTTIISGRDSKFLAEQFKGLPIRLVAEHGAKAYDPITQKWVRRIHRSRADWYPAALKIISDYTARVPHSRIEKKEFSVAWHYRLSPVEFGDFQARKLAEELELGLANLPVNILRGKKVIEVRAIEADKGVYASSYLASLPLDVFVIAIGDDRTDEDLFHVIRNQGYSFRVGRGPSTAAYNFVSQSQVMPFIKELTKSLAPNFKNVEAHAARESYRAAALNIGTEQRR